MTHDAEGGIQYVGGSYEAELAVADECLSRLGREALAWELITLPDGSTIFGREFLSKCRGPAGEVVQAFVGMDPSDPDYDGSVTSLNKIVGRMIGEQSSDESAAV